MAGENAGFRGSIVHVSEAAIVGAPTGFKVTFRVLFSDAEGVVHAVTRHEIDPPEGSEMRAAAARLVETITKWTETTHFVSPSDAIPNKKEAIIGLAESLRDSSDAPGGFIPQG